MPGVSCHQQLGHFSFGIESRDFLSFALQQQLNRFGKITKTFLSGFTLPISTGHFQAGGPETVFLGFPTMNYRCESSHVPTIPRTADEDKVFLR